MNTESLVREWARKTYPDGYELYADYNDYVSDRDIREILESEHPDITFNEKLYYAYGCADADFPSLVEKLRDDVPELRNEDTDTLIECLCDSIDLKYPAAHYLNQKVRVDVYVDTGDSDYDFTCNCMYPHYNGRREWLKDEIIMEDEFSKASLFWLAQTQGYSKKQFVDFLYKNTDDSTFRKNGFLNSVFQEMANMPVHMAKIVFLQTYTLAELLEIVVRKKDIQIPLGTMCGLYDDFNGGGGPLEIELEKPLVIPHDKIYEILPAGSYSYSIDNCYGLVEEAWRPRKIKLAA